MSTAAIVALTLAAVFIGGPVLLICIGIAVGISQATSSDDSELVALADDAGSGLVIDTPPIGARKLDANLTVEAGDGRLKIGLSPTGNAPDPVRRLDALLADAGPREPAPPSPEALARIVALGLAGQDPTVATVVALAPSLGVEVKDEASLARLIGTHPFSVQWLQGAPKGDAVIELAEEGLMIDAAQEGDDGSGATVSGRVVRVDASGFVVDGVAQWQSARVGAGLCVHRGLLTFRAGAKDFSPGWRLQPTAGSGCKGTTDHFDIYFNKTQAAE